MTIKKEELKRNVISDEESEVRYQKILAYLDNHKPYLDTKINITKFSGDLNESVHNISLSINQKFNMTFFELINSFRIKEAQYLLKNADLSKTTIENIASEVGFNTPSSFYRAFKKYTQI